MAFSFLRKEDQWEPISLNEKNVERIYRECLPTTTTQDFEPSTLMARPDLFNVVDRLQFDKRKLDKQRDNIEFMLGQMRDVHKHKYLMMDHSILKYDGTNWTESRRVEMEFLHLCKACDLIESFDIGKRGLMSYLTDTVVPTLDPEDDNFKTWYKSYKK